ncbi:uncharacterized protein LOC117319020 [Pecten maximus]|uniref:uncharacterized protein LOC117319020 n=1 Tax=Pecten maximus TaxID=6579 RepID=UPI00145833DA|nr:uncharacterized protein LOC117319020 [Pecten maximus]
MEEVFDDEDGAFSFIKKQEIEEGVRYVAKKSRNIGLTDVSTLNQKKVWWADDNGIPHIAYDGVPFVVIGTETRECHHGPQRPHGKKRKNTVNDHNQAQKGRRILQNTKKQNCTAAVKLKKILKFPEFAMEGDDTRWKRQKIAIDLRNEFSADTVKQLKIYVSVPSVDAHGIHPVGELAGYTIPMDKEVSMKIRSCVDEGVRNVAEMRRHLATFVETELLPQYPDIMKTNRRFYPTNRDIRNSIYRCLSETRFSSNDQEDLRMSVEKWKSSQTTDNFFYRPVSSNESDPNSFLFIHQTAWQQSLLLKYGQEICLLDATYNTTVYDLPLFFLCVNTNCGFTIVGSFLVGRESRYNIQEAISIIAGWNPKWKPMHFITDNDQREIGAIENCFPECLVYICDFHREQAWDRWLKDGKHGIGNEDKSDVLSRLRCIANSTSEQEYEENLNQLRESSAYKCNTTLSSYLEKTWIAHYKRWVYTFRKDLVNIRVNTTNGLERQHKDFKEQYLKNYTLGRTLCGMLHILINDFLPQSITTYVRYQVQSMSSYRKYSDNLPTFLNDTPKVFVKHCVERIPPLAEEIHASHIRREPDRDVFLVESVDSGKVYELFLQSSIPSCTCIDWKKTHWPCKHMLAVFRHYPGHSWEFLPEVYTNSPYFCIDLEHTNTSISQTESLAESGMPTDGVDDPIIMTPSVDTVRQECFDVMKEINSALYSVNSVDNMHVCLQHIQVLHSEVKKYQESVNGLPIRSLLPRRKKRSSRRKHFSRSKPRPTISSAADQQQETRSSATQCNVEFDGIIYDDIVVGKHTSDDDKVMHESNDSSQDKVLLESNDSLVETDGNQESECIKMINKIWRNKQGHNILLAKIGPYNIYDNSVLYLQSTLSDEVIDAYIHHLTNGLENVYHVNCLAMTAIFNGEDVVHGMLKKVDIYSYDTLIGAYNEGGFHWTLILFPEEALQHRHRCCTYPELDSFLTGTCQTKRQSILWSLCAEDCRKLPHEQGCSFLIITKSSFGLPKGHWNKYSCCNRPN